MISLSNVFKPQSPKNEPRLIHIKEVFKKNQYQHSNNHQTDTEKSINQLKQQAELMFNEAEAKFRQAESEIHKMKEAARQEIEQDQKAWEQEKQKLAELAQNQGYQAGFEQGQKQAEDQYSRIIQETREIINLAKKDYDDKLADSEQQILEIALKASEKILQAKLAEEPGLFLNIVRSAIQEVKQMPHVNVYVHPSQFELVMDYKPELKNIVDGNGHLSIYPKSDLAEHSCIIESPFGKVDASLDTQVRELRTKLFRMFEEAKSLENE